MNDFSLWLSFFWQYLIQIVITNHKERPMFYEYYTNNPCFQKINEALYKMNYFRAKLRKLLNNEKKITLKRKETLEYEINRQL